MSKTIQYHFLNSIAQAVNEVIDRHKHADRVIDKYVRTNSNWKPEERKLFYDSVYEVIRNKYLYEFLVESEESVLLAAAAQHLFGNKCVAHANLNHLDYKKINERKKINKPDYIEHSIPEWLYLKIKAEVGEDTVKLLKALNEQPRTYLRVNTLKIDTLSLIKKLNLEKIKVEVPKITGLELSDCVCLIEGRNIFATQAYREGLFEMQDAGSQSIASLLQVAPGMDVLDACCGTGGKTLQIAALMKNSGKLTAMDVVEKKLVDLKIRAEKAGVKIINTKLINSPKLIQSLENKFDRLLLDAPCSGTGVFKRNPESKWNISQDLINDLKKTQADILKNYTKTVKPGGRVVYSTCSILSEENEEQIQFFLTSELGKKFKLEKELRIWPHRHMSDGFYAAVLVRE